MGFDILIPNFINSTIDIYDFPEKIMGNGINKNVVVSTHTVRIYLRFATEFLEYFSESHSSGTHSTHIPHFLHTHPLKHALLPNNNKYYFYNIYYY